MPIRPLHIFSILLICSPLLFLWHTTSSNTQMTTIKFWNGNKSSSRQSYEREVLDAVLAATRKGYGNIPVQEDQTDYPDPEDEAGIFRIKEFDLFGTVAGNPKLAGEKKSLIPHPMMKGLLGYRILIVRAEDQEKFAAISQATDLQNQAMGIPFGWADAELFRRNGYEVVEAGGFDELFANQLKKKFAYTTFGANEIENVFGERAASLGGLAIDQSLLLYYPFPLVFYVNPENLELVSRMNLGMQIIVKNGELDKIFERHFGNLAARLQLNERNIIHLENPLLPAELRNFKSILLKN